MSARLIVEVDGPSHWDRRQRDLDRSRALNTLGFTVLRFDNAEVLTDPARVLAKIRHHVRVAARRPLPAAGEGSDLE